MTVIHVNMDIQLPEGFSEYEIETDRNLELNFRADKNCDVFVRIKKGNQIRLRTYAAKDVTVNYLFWNDCKQNLVVDESHEVSGNANVTVGYGEMNGASTKRNIYMVLRESGARGLLRSSTLVNCEKQYHMQVVNEAPHTYGDMKNFAVVLKEGNLMIDAIGKIVKGSYQSESHQTSRALSFEEGQRATILPELLIDEDDVQASHAMSMGTVDSDAMYYLMTRGLSMKQCTSLIAQGYLLPIVDTLQNEQLQSTLKEEMERKLIEIC